MKFLSILKLIGTFIKNNKKASFLILFALAITITGIVLSVKVKNLRHDVELLEIKNLENSREISTLKADTAALKTELRNQLDIQNYQWGIEKKNNPGLSSQPPTLEEIKNKRKKP